MNAHRKRVGEYRAGANWKASDGSRASGRQVAVPLSAQGNIPLQWVKAEPAMGADAMNGLSHIRRVDTEGGVAPAAV